MGFESELAHGARGGPIRLRRDPKGDGALGRARHAGRACVDSGDGGSLRRALRSGQARGSGSRLRRRHEDRRRRVSGRPRRGNALRRGLVSARAARRRAGHREPECPADRRRAGAGAEGRHPSSRRVPSVHPRHRSDERAGARRCVRRIPRPLDSRRQPHQSHAVARLDADRPMGRRRAGKSRRLAFGPEVAGRRRRHRHLSVARPADARVRRVDGRAGRDRHASRPRLCQDDARIRSTCS